MKFLLILIILAFSHSLFASDELTARYFTWDDLGERSSVHLINKHDKDKSNIITAIIGRSEDGVQRIYFSIEFHGKYNMCLPKQISETSIAKLDGQPVKMRTWCNKYTYSNSNNYYLTITPETIAGRKFVVSRFKTAPKEVLFEHEGIVVYIPAKGFTKAWKQFGGDAL
ncbi:MAG: hypothetical protein H6998_18925 [Hahellaceae bacterium]|nr:hypothetical protein [Hahellaceae bacterium]